MYLQALFWIFWEDFWDDFWYHSCWVFVGNVPADDFVDQGFTCLSIIQILHQSDRLISYTVIKRERCPCWLLIIDRAQRSFCVISIVFSLYPLKTSVASFHKSLFKDRLHQKSRVPSSYRVIFGLRFNQKSINPRFRREISAL